MLIVRYNGGNDSLYFSNSPYVLTKGALYIVERMEVSRNHTNYYLLGLPGAFNSVWFDDVAETAGRQTEVKHMFMLTR